MGKPLRSSQPVPWWVWTIMVVGAIQSVYLAGVNKPGWSMAWTCLWFVSTLAGLKLYRRSQCREVIEDPRLARPALPAQVVRRAAVPAQMVRRQVEPPLRAEIVQQGRPAIERGARALTGGRDVR